MPTRNATIDRACPANIRAFYYRQNSNFGDVLTPYLIKKLFGLHVRHTSFTTSCNFIGVGSILDKLSETPDNVTVWGSGFMYEESTFSIKNQTILAVRGKYTASHLTGVAENLPLGDPGLLVSKTFSPLPKSHKIGFVPHYIDQNEEISKRIKDLPDVHYINIMQEPESFLKELSTCEYVISSSLHGCIAAESLGIPNLHVMLSSKVYGLNFKFRDYYSAFNLDHKYEDFRHDQPRDITTTKLLNLIEKNYQKPTNLEDINNGLIKSFEDWMKR